MKFDVVVGNPPYQEDSGTSARDNAIYPYFYDLAEKAGKKYCLISPARFLFNAGSTAKEWNKKMLNNEYLKVVHFHQKSSEMFAGTDIKGGVAVIYYDESVCFGAIETFTSHPELQSIMKKVENKVGFIPISNIMTGRGVYRLTNTAHVEHPEIENLQSKGHKNDVGSGAFKILDNIIFFNDKPSDRYNHVKVLGLENSNRVYKFINTDFMNEPYGFKSYKVALPKANGSGTLGEVLSTPLVLEPNIGFTETFISIGAFDSEVEAQNTLKYIKSKFARTMLGILKITQDNPRDKWSKVPIQNFTSESDINWTEEIKEIDKLLYLKYDLDQSEIDFIENNVKEMY